MANKYTLLKVAENEIGYLEKKDKNNLNNKIENAGHENYTKYAEECFPELQGLSWCCMFIWWCFEKTFGKIMARNLIGEKTAKCSVMKDRMVDIGCKVVDIDFCELGDIVFFKNSFNNICHVGIISGHNLLNINTIEGNTLKAKDILVSNGGGVYSKTYQKNNKRIACIIRPKWELLEHEKQLDEMLENTKYNAEIKATNVNIRTGAGTDNPKIGMETLGFKFQIIGEDFDSFGIKWYKFKYKNQDAFIRSDFINIKK